MLAHDLNPVLDLTCGDFLAEEIATCGPDRGSLVGYGPLVLQAAATRLGAELLCDVVERVGRGLPAWLVLMAGCKCGSCCECGLFGRQSQPESTSRCYLGVQGRSEWQLLHCQNHLEMWRGLFPWDDEQIEGRRAGNAWVWKQEIMFSLSVVQ